MLTILAAIGATIILTQSKLFRFMQEIHYFFKCTLCMGVWVGAVFYLLHIETALDAFLYGFITSLCSYTWWLLMKYFIDKYD